MYGQVGNGYTVIQTTPYEVTQVGTVKSVEIYDETVYTITEEGKLYAWGENYYGQVGNGSTSDQTTPYEVTQVGKVKSVEVDSDDYGNDFTVYAITEDGRLYAWGANSFGKVGNGSTTNQRTPYEVTSVGKVKSLEISDSTVYAITEDNRLYAWGANGYGEVGNGTTTNQTTPYEVTSVGKVKSVEVYSDDYYGDTVYAITEDGRLYAWGYNGSDGKVGNGSTRNQTIPYEVTQVGTVKSVEEYNDTVYAITEEGKLYAWGYNGSDGKVGNGSTSEQTTPYEVTSVGKVKSVIGSSTVYAITEDGRLYSWGDNYSGQVGNGESGSNVKQLTPYEVKEVGTVKSLKISGRAVYAITEDNRLYAWGDNYYGQVGNGSTSNQTTPYYISEVK